MPSWSFLLIELLSSPNTAAGSARVRAMSVRDGYAEGERYIIVLGELEVLNVFELRVFRTELSAQQV